MDGDLKASWETARRNRDFYANAKIPEMMMYWDGWCSALIWMDKGWKVHDEAPND